MFTPNTSQASVIVSHESLNLTVLRIFLQAQLFKVFFPAHVDVLGDSVDHFETPLPPSAPLLSHLLLLRLLLRNQFWVHWLYVLLLEILKFFSFFLCFQLQLLYFCNYLLCRLSFACLLQRFIRFFQLLFQFFAFFSLFCYLFVQSF